MRTPRQEIEFDLDRITNLLIEAVKVEWIGQNKKASGKALKTIGQRSKQILNGISTEVLVEDYMEYQDRGVSAGNIAFSAGSGAGKSMLIDGLIGWIAQKVPDTPESDRLGFAIAIARSWQNQDGMPSGKSKAFSNNGRNLEWSRYALQEAQPKMDKILEGSNFVEALIDEIVFETNKSLSI